MENNMRATYESIKNVKLQILNLDEFNSFDDVRIFISDDRLRIMTVTIASNDFKCYQFVRRFESLKELESLTEIENISISSYSAAIKLAKDLKKGSDILDVKIECLCKCSIIKAVDDLGSYTIEIKLDKARQYVANVRYDLQSKDDIFMTDVTYRTRSNISLEDVSSIIDQIKSKNTQI